MCDKKVYIQIGLKSNPVFLSYSSKFANRVSQLKQAIEARGIPCCMAINDMVEDVQPEIAKAIKTAPAIVMCYSRSYRDSKYANFKALQHYLESNLLKTAFLKCIL